MQVGFDKALGLGFKALQRGGGLIENTKWLKNSVGFLASSPFFDENVINGPKEKRVNPPPSGIFTALRRYVPTYGYILSLVCLGVGKLINKFLPPLEEGKAPPFLIGVAKTFIKWASTLIPLITLYSQFKGYQVEYQCPITGKILQDAAKYSDLLKTAKEGDGVYSSLLIAKNKPLRFKEIEEKVVSSTTSNVRNNVIRRIYWGPTGTGKTEAMRKNCIEIIETIGKEKVEVLSVECQALKQHIHRIMETSGDLLSLANMASEIAGEQVGEAASNIASWNTTNQVNELKKYFACVRLLAKEQLEKGEGYRFVLLLDEVDKLREFAIENRTNQNPDGEMNWELLIEISNELKALFRDPNIDLFATSNINMNEFFGLGGNYSIFRIRDQLEKTPLGPSHASIVPCQVKLDKPDLKQQSDIAAGYIMLGQKKLNETDDQFFDHSLKEIISDKMSTDRLDKETAIARIVEDEIYSKMEESKKSLFENDFRSREVEISVKDALNSLFSGSQRNNNKLTLEKIKESLLEVMVRLHQDTSGK